MASPFDLQRIGAGLPFTEAVPRLRDALTTAGSTAVVQAPPGTGKTTLVPPLLAQLVQGQGRVVVTQPRRVAARAAARRLSDLAGTRLGDEVGYTVRGDSRCGPHTAVEICTAGVLLRRMLHDPGLDGVAAVVLDEVHERSLDSDLLVGLLGDLRELRDDLRLVAMSATLDAARFADLLGDGDSPAPLVDCPSALHPLATQWTPFGSGRLDERGVARGFLDHVARVTADAHSTELMREPSTDALVFVPGAREVDHVVAALRGLTSAEVIPLHGQVPAAKQDRATSGRDPAQGPRVVVSTDIAESSLTVPGVRLVVDAGLSREPRLDRRRRMSGLVTVSCSRASADQRAGRAARQGPGVVVRCYEESEYALFAAHLTPEVATADLTSAALTLACWGAPGGDGLRLPDPLPAASRALADETLRALGAVDEDGRVTKHGRRLGEVPADPRDARALLDGAALVGVRTAAEVVAATSLGDRVHDADLERHLARLRSGSLRRDVAERWHSETRRLTTLVDAPRDVDLPSGSTRHPVGLVVALAHPDRVARLLSAERGIYLLAGGSRAALPPDSSLHGHEWLAVADVGLAPGRVAQGTGAVIRAAAPLDLETATRAAPSLAVEEVRATFTPARDSGRGRVTARAVKAFGAIELAATPAPPTTEAARVAVADALARDGLTVVPVSEAADRFRRRMSLLHNHVGAPWPDVSDETLIARALEPGGGRCAGVLDRLAGLAPGRPDLLDVLQALLPWPEAARLDELAPERLVVASGAAIRVDYPPVGEADERPVVQVKLQECFGWADSPRVAGGRVPILFHLLSPARRPLAVTDDLASFWAGPYQEVRKEMRGRYPRHPWPEDPWTATATARTTRRLREG